ncbi:unnamed protein product [Symbiodinium microadriaticum]|nr:unnamed protein product [Symbiodinium microadriaticum]
MFCSLLMLPMGNDNKEVGCVHSPIPLFPMNQNHPALQPGGSDGCLFHALALAGQYLFTPQEFFNLPDETMQCFVEDASSGKVVAPEARLSAEAANRLGAAIGDPVVVIGREPKLKAAAKPKEVKEPKGKAAAKQKEVEVEAKVQPFTKFIGSPLFEYFTPASALLGNVAAVSVPRLLRRLFAHIHVADFGTVVAAGLGVFSHETPQGTVEERRHLQQVARELAADGDRAWLPSQLAAHLAGQGRAVTMNARTLRRQAAQMQGFRLVSNTGKNKRQTKAVTAPSDWQACVAANQDPDRGLLCFVSTPPSGSFVAVLPPLLDEVASIHAHGYLGPYSVSADCTFRVEIDDWVYLLVTASLHRMLDGRWRRSGLPVLFARHPVETNELYAVAFAALCTALDRRLEHFFRNLSEKTVRDLETGETIKVPMEHCWEERDVAAYLKRQYSVERRLNEAIYGWPAGLGVPLSPDEWSGVEWSGVELPTSVTKARASLALPACQGTCQGSDARARVQAQWQSGHNVTGASAVGRNSRLAPLQSLGDTMGTFDAPLQSAIVLRGRCCSTRCEVPVECAGSGKSERAESAPVPMEGHPLPMKVCPVGWRGRQQQATYCGGGHLKVDTPVYDMHHGAVQQRPPVPEQASEVL